MLHCSGYVFNAKIYSDQQQNRGKLRQISVKVLPKYMMASSKYTEV